MILEENSYALSFFTATRHPGEGFAYDGRDATIRRRRLRGACGAPFTTFEHVH